tara:strand:+ start:2337 stop:2702 length:366 start_codon:yes stop_codon:yes gene_type:complete
MSDQDEIQNTIQTYFDCMYESDGAKALEAFHPSAKITGYIQDELQQMSVDDFAKFVDSKSPSHKENGDPIVLETLSLEIAGDTAVARVRDAYIGRNFLDTLSLLKVNGKWVIYNKLFHIES